MKKIKTLFVRDEEDRSRVTRVVDPDCAWVLVGEGVPTVKWDGTSCMLSGGILHKRREVKRNATCPEDFIVAGTTETKTQGWIPVGDGPEDKHHREAFVGHNGGDGTYELTGPKIQGNPHGFPDHRLIPHGVHRVAFDPRDFDAIASVLDRELIEGIVWHHPDGRMAKIKRRDFGLAWPA